MRLWPVLPTLVCSCSLGFTVSLGAAPVSRYVDSYYPTRPDGELRLNYYYDRTGRWVKFSDWVPVKRHRIEPAFFEDFYGLYGLPPAYNTEEIKESIYYLTMALSSRFKHQRGALCEIKNEAEYHKYRSMMYMQTNLLIMRMFLRLGSMYDKRFLYSHDLDVADDLTVSFRIAKAYYEQAKPYWELAKKYAVQASQHRFELDLPGIESERFNIISGKTNFERIIDRHIVDVSAKIEVADSFVAREGSPRPVKQAMQRDIETMYDPSFTNEPISAPRLSPHLSEPPLFPGEP
ncbi:MAG: hypothetical protein JNM27_18005 [Leptospirales bacterium]|nr:hypothetical protein [Leptospirales bacterium]